MRLDVDKGALTRATRRLRIILAFRGSGQGDIDWGQLSQEFDQIEDEEVEEEQSRASLLASSVSLGLSETAGLSQRSPSPGSPWSEPDGNDSEATQLREAAPDRTTVLCDVRQGGAVDTVRIHGEQWSAREQGLGRDAALRGEGAAREREGGAAQPLAVSVSVSAKPKFVCPLPPPRRAHRRGRDILGSSGGALRSLQGARPAASDS